MEKPELDSIIENLEKLNIRGLRSSGGYLARKGALKESHNYLEAAAVAYALSKILQHDFPKEVWGDYRTKVLDLLRSIDVSDDTDVEMKLDQTLEVIGEFDSKTGKFSQNLRERSRINKATTAYSSGLSIGKAAQLSGVTEWHIMAYSGSTRLSDEIGVTKEISERLKKAREVLA